MTEGEPKATIAWERMSLAEKLASLPDERRAEVLKEFGKARLFEMITGWAFRARPAQTPPEAADWKLWLLIAGRGYGKTRAGAGWVHAQASGPDVRIALVGPTEEEARAVMVEGASGILAVAPDGERPRWEPSLGRLTWPTGAQGFVYSAANPEALRGPEHDLAWCDEVAKWPRGEACWDNLAFGLRRGLCPKVLATTTPRPVPLLRRLMAQGDAATTGGRTAENMMLAPGFAEHVTKLYGGTRFGRQELDGELIEDVEGSLWPRSLIEASRGRAPVEMRRVVVGVDPPASAGGDGCGIVVCALGPDGEGYVLEDASVSGMRPEGWARTVAAAAARWDADRVVAEGNQGGDMVESVLRSADVRLPVRIVHARHGKTVRAEPVASLFERGAARFAGVFPELEDELSGMTIGGGYEGPGRSPDRADAMVWALTELMVKRPRAEPGVRRL
jgi:phage terminase large subunit-like protein